MLACDDEVRFGPPDGLRTEEGGNVDLCMPDAIKAIDCAANPAPDWPSAIFAPLFDQPTKYGCTTDACHGIANGGGLRMVKGDSTASYDALLNYKNGSLTYISNDQNTAYILCNLLPDEALLIGNQPMPVITVEVTSFIIGTDFDTIAHWVHCGMPRTGTPVMAGSGGAGGALGAGGAGGI